MSHTKQETSCPPPPAEMIAMDVSDNELALAPFEPQFAFPRDDREEDKQPSTPTPSLFELAEPQPHQQGPFVDPVLSDLKFQTQGKRARGREEADYEELALAELEGKRALTKRRKTTHVGGSALPFFGQQGALDPLEVKLGPASYIAPGSGRGVKRTRGGAVISSGAGFRPRPQDPWSSEFEEQRFAPRRRTGEYEFRGGQPLVAMTPAQSEAQSRALPSSRAEQAALRDAYFARLLSKRQA